MSIPVPPAMAGGRKGPEAVAGEPGGAEPGGGRSVPDRDALQQMLATRGADCDALLGAVVERLRHAVVASPGGARAPAESAAAIRATVLQCADDLAHVRDLLLQPVRGAAAMPAGQNALPAVSAAGSATYGNHKEA